MKDLGPAEDSTGLPGRVRQKAEDGRCLEASVCTDRQGRQYRSRKRTGVV